MTPEEAQQAETVAEIKRYHNAPQYFNDANASRRIHLHREKLLKIVDSQAQKISEQANEIERLKDLVRKTSGADPDAHKRQEIQRKVYRPDLATIIPDSAGGVLTDSKEVAR